MAVLPKDDDTSCPGTSGIIVGWGSDEGDINPKIMKRLELVVMQGSYCKTYIENFDETYQFCASYQPYKFDKSATRVRCFHFRLKQKKKKFAKNYISDIVNNWM